MQSFVEITPQFGEASLAPARERLDFSKLSFAVLDLDQTIVLSRAVHTELFSLHVQTNFGLTAPEVATLLNTFSELRALPYAKILEALYKRAEESRALGITVDRFVELFFELPAKVAKGEIVLTRQATPIPGADSLISAIKNSSVPFKVCTGSPRELAKLLLNLAGLSDKVLESDLVCHADTAFDKEHPEYWEKVLGTTDRASAIGFDDHPSSARALLTSGQIAKVIIRPESHPNDLSYQEQLAELVREFGPRVQIVKAWEELL